MHEHGYLIVKRDLYYMPNCQGYTGIRDQAGRYSREFVEQHCDPNYGLTFVHESEAPEFRQAAFSDLVIAHLIKQRDQARAEARAAALEEAAKLLDLNASQLLLMAGEMTAQELRTVRAVLRSRVAAIRALIEESP